MDQPLSHQEQLFQNIGIGPHLPLVPVPTVCTALWTEPSWARSLGLTVEEYRQVQLIESRRTGS